MIFSFSEGDYAYSDKVEELGFDTHNMIYNLGSMYYFIVITFIALLVSVILIKCKIKYPCMKKVKKHLKWKTKANELFIIFQEGFVEILVSGYLNF